MTQVFYANFLENRSAYQTAQAYWHGFFTGQLSSSVAVIKPYLNTEDDLDGNPIYALYTPDTGRAIRILQNPPEEGMSSLPFTAWLDKIAISEQQTLDELVVSLVLSEENSRKVALFTQKWLIEGISKREMDLLLDSYCKIAEQ